MELATQRTLQAIEAIVDFKIEGTEREIVGEVIEDDSTDAMSRAMEICDCLGIQYRGNRREISKTLIAHESNIGD